MIIIGQSLTVHSALLDVLLCFHMHKVALTTEISKMYRGAKLMEDFHHFIWRSAAGEITDYLMTPLSLQNSLDLAHIYVRAFENSFYVNVCLTGANTVEKAKRLQHELCEMFQRGGFLLRK